MQKQKASALAHELCEFVSALAAFQEIEAMIVRMPRNLGEQYSPLYFLAALGTGGLVVIFFMWLLFWIPHPGRPIPIFEDIASALSAVSLLHKTAIIGALLGIGFFAFLRMRLLVWNLQEYAAWRKTRAYAALRRGNNETQLLAAPLALAMMVNVGFIIGLVFVPRLWSVVEYLFPLALIAFLWIGVWALRLLLTSAALFLQAATIWLVFTLNAKHFGSHQSKEFSVPAE